MNLSRIKGICFHQDDAIGHPLSGGKVYTYAAGSNIKATTYNSLGMPNENPVKLNMRGDADIWLDSAVKYKFVVKSAIGTTVAEVDNISADTMTFTAEGGEYISTEEVTEDGRTVIKFSIKPNSIDKSRLKGARDLVPDEDHFKISLVDGKAVLSLADSLVAKLQAAGVDIE